MYTCECVRMYYVCPYSIHVYACVLPVNNSPVKCYSIGRRPDQFNENASAIGSFQSVIVSLAILGTVLFLRCNRDKSCACPANV